MTNAQCSFNAQFFSSLSLHHLLDRLKIRPLRECIIPRSVRSARAEAADHPLESSDGRPFVFMIGGGRWIDHFHLVVLQMEVCQMAYGFDVFDLIRRFRVRQYRLLVVLPEHVHLDLGQLAVHVVCDHVCDVDVPIENVVQL